ncbi:MAG: methyl-accepting chemotaxis protein, partial [Rhodoferax sp.]|uniref:methyl-accepting chemotaxis protein n=1 Tax=Rhodoferax sp. TaxID=50421 RepID=UPI00301B0F37
MNLNNYKIGTRLTVLLAVLSALLVAVGAFGLATLSKADETMHLIYSDRMVPTHQLDEINFYMIRNRLVISNTLIEPTPERIAKYTKEVETNIAGISKLWESYSKTSMSAENARLSKLFAETRREFVQKGLLPAVAALRDNNLPEARRLVLEGLSPLHDATKPHLIALLKNIQEDAASEYAASAARYQTVRNISVAAIIGGLLFAVIFGLFLVRGITRPLARAVDIADDIANGKLDGAIKVDSTDETGHLLTSLAQMQTVLAKFQSAQNEMAQQHGAGMIDYVMPTHELPGAYAAMAQAANEVVQSHIAVKMR